MPTPITLSNGRLADRQIASYWEDGFLFPIPVMTADEAVELRGELEAIERDWRERDLPHPLNTYKRVNAQHVMPLAHRIGTDPRILDVVEGLIGSDILLYSVEFFIKEPKTAHIVSMHQDLTYWGLGAIDGLVTAWLALSPATPASGCMDFVAGSHKNAILPHEDTFDDNNLLSRGQEVRVEVALEDKVPIEIHPGQISLHHGLTIHGSGPNTSDDRRIAAAIRYVTPEIARDTSDRDYAIVARGADRLGHFINVAPPEGLFTPNAMTLYEEIRVAQAKTMMAGARGKAEIYA